MKVTWSRQAEEQIEEIKAYLDERNPDAAVRLVQALVHRTFVLEEHPLIGRMVPEHGHEKLRELIEQGYRMFYLVGADSIEIVTVFHSRMGYAPEQHED